jgi:predicted anti-sigma-YlaC factor YlaD
MNLSEFAEKQLVGAQLNEALERVEHHLSLCPECAEEYQALKRVLEALR